MKGFLTLLTVCVVLAIVRAALTALLVALALMLLYSFITRPRQTLMFLVNIVLFGLATAHPVAFTFGVCIIAATVVAVAAWQKRPLRSGRTGDSGCEPASSSDRHLLR